MRLVFLNTIAVWGGGERWTLETALAMRARGHDVELVVSGGGPLEAKAREHDLDTRAWPASWVEQRGFVRRLRTVHRERPPRALIGATGRDVRLASRLRPRGADTLLVFARQLDKRLTNPVARRITFRDLDLVVANSESTRRTMRASLRWFPEDRLVTVYNAFDAEAFSVHEPQDVRAAHGIAPDAFLVGAVGRLDRQKGLDVLIRAFADVRAHVPGAVLLLTGTGDQEEPLRAQARAAGLEEAMRFAGHVDTVQPHYAACDVIAVPSRFEGFCYTAVEAQALGRPVVATRVSSLPEVVADGVSGYLVGVDDAGALAARLRELAGDEALRRRLGDAGRKHICRFEPGLVYDALARVLKTTPRR